MSTNNIRIAVQKSGRLSDDSLKLFKECGIKFESGGSKLRSISSNFPIEFLFLRDDDIPGYVADGVADTPPPSPSDATQTTNETKNK